MMDKMNRQHDNQDGVRVAPGKKCCRKAASVLTFFFLAFNLFFAGNAAPLFFHFSYIIGYITLSAIVIWVSFQLKENLKNGVILALISSFVCAAVVFVARIIEIKLFITGESYTGDEKKLWNRYYTCLDYDGCFDLFDRAEDILMAVWFYGSLTATLFFIIHFISKISMLNVYLFSCVPLVFNLYITYLLYVAYINYINMVIK